MATNRSAEKPPGQVSQGIVAVFRPNLYLLEDGEFLDSQVIVNVRLLFRPEAPQSGHQGDFFAISIEPLGTPPHRLDHFLEASSGLVEVDVLVHVVTSKDKLLDGELGLLVPDNVSHAVLFV
jgi:hypothetical protein